MKEKNFLNILLIDDDHLTHENFARIFENTKYRLHLASDSIEGLHEIKKTDYNLVLLDVIMPDLKGRQSQTAGLELLELIVELRPELPVIMMSVVDEKLVEAIKLGAKDYIVKSSLTSELLLEKIEKQIFYEPLKSEITNILRAKKQIDEYDLLKILKEKGTELKEFKNILEEMEKNEIITVDSFLIKYNRTKI